jgi:Beta-propeller repeat
MLNATNDNAFVAKLDPSASGSASLLYSTYLGGSDGDAGNGIAVDSSGHAYVIGDASSADFPLVNPIKGSNAAGRNASFVAELDPSASGAASLLFSTYFGGTNVEYGSGVAVDRSGNAYVVGQTGSTDFPVTSGAYQSSLAGSTDAFVAKILFCSAPPAITIINPTAIDYTLNETEQAAYTCSSTCSTIVSCTGTVPNGNDIDTASVGAKTFTVNATDTAGNTNTVAINYNVGYGVCALYDQSVAVHLGATIPIKLQLCDAAGTDVSSSGVVVHATGLKLISTSTPADVEDSGNSNPDDDFRFDSTLGATGGYIFNLKTSDLSSGTWGLSFTATGDPVAHSASFAVK